MDDSPHGLTPVEQQIADLQARVAALEARFPPPSANAAEPPSLPSGELASLGHQHDGSPLQEGTPQGELLYAGVLEVARKRYQRQRRQPISAAFEAPAQPLAQLFAALASPHRVILLRTLCQGPRSSQALQELLGMSSAGQLYHHLNELLAVGLIVQHGRRDYDIAPSQQPLICLVLALASDLMTEKQREEAPPPDQEGSSRENEVNQ